MFSASVCLFVGLCICAYYVHNNTSCTWLPCDFTAANLTAALNTGVVTVSSLAKLQVQDTKKQRQYRCEADGEWKCQK